MSEGSFVAVAQKSWVSCSWKNASCVEWKTLITDDVTRHICMMHLSTWRYYTVHNFLFHLIDVLTTCRSFSSCHFNCVAPDSWLKWRKDSILIFKVKNLKKNECLPSGERQRKVYFNIISLKSQIESKVEIVLFSSKNSVL